MSFQDFQADFRADSREQKISRRLLKWTLSAAASFLLILPIQAQCPEGAPSCTTLVDVEVVDWEIDLNEDTEICEDLAGATYQAFEEAGEGSEGLIAARIFHPADADGELIEDPLPIVLHVPGNGLDYENYDLLLTHLAGQEMIAVSLQADPTSTAAVRADILLCGLRVMLNIWERSQVLPVAAFLGHSRGGEGAVMAANRHHELETVENSPWEQDVEIRAVAAMAPAANCDGSTGCTNPAVTPDYIAEHANLYDEATPAFFTIFGTRDSDVEGKALRLYEDASPEAPFMNDDMTKASILVHDVHHFQWGGFVPGTPGSKGQVLARAYVGSFLSWWLTGRTELRPFFTGEEIPPCVADPLACGLEFDPLAVFPQYREGASYDGDRLLIHGFQPPMMLDPSILGPVQDVPLGSAHIEDMLTYNSGHSSLVNTHTAVVPRGDTREAKLRFDSGNQRNFTDYAFLSVRLGKPIMKQGEAEADCWLIDADDLDVGVTLEDGDGVRHEVRSSDFVRIAPPDLFMSAITQTNTESKCTGFDHLTTLRVPLIDFWQGGVDPTGVRKVELAFERAPADGNDYEVYVDSLELTINNLDQHCGNGVIEGPEICDSAPPAGETCEDYGFIGGNMSCSAACLPSTAGCIAAICGDGVVEGDEECDDGNLEIYDRCTPECTICPPGDPLCGCLGSEPGEEDPSLPYDGVLGDGLYCNDDVLYGGMNRCVEMVGGNKACIPCSMDNGPFCPCDTGNSCFPNYDPAFGPDVAIPDAPLDGLMSCNYALAPEGAPGAGKPANDHGYCFAVGENVEDGGTPSWFYDWYCEHWVPTSLFSILPEGYICTL